MRRHGWRHYPKQVDHWYSIIPASDRVNSTLADGTYDWSVQLTSLSQTWQRALTALAVHTKWKHHHIMQSLALKNMCADFLLPGAI